MERQPVKTIPIHEHLRPRLCDTYENDSIFDKFEVVFSGDAKNVMTGSYNNNFMIYPSDPDKETEVVLQADKSAFKAKKIGVPTPINNPATSPTANGGKKNGSRANSPSGAQRMRKETDADQIDFNKKILHMSWHPFEDSIAIAATNNVRTLRRCSFGGVLTLGSFLFSQRSRLVKGQLRMADKAFGNTRVRAAGLSAIWATELLGHTWYLLGISFSTYMGEHEQSMMECQRRGSIMRHGRTLGCSASAEVSKEKKKDKRYDQRQ